MGTLLITRWIMAACVPLVVGRLRRRALARNITRDRLPTADDCVTLRRNARMSKIVLLAFWLVTSVLVTMLGMLDGPRSVEWAGFVPISILGAVWVAAQLRVLCPSCRYPLGYQRACGVPATCGRCGVALK